MTRITPAMVRSAYSACGRQPARGLWDDGERCCGEAALYLVAWARRERCGLAVRHSISQWIAAQHGVDYELGFRMGWDGLRNDPDWLDDIQAGYADGRAAAEAVLGQ